MNDALPPTPFIALDVDVFDRNARRMAHTICTQGGKRWRPHVKSIRSPVLAQRLVDAGAIGVTCATANEAQAMVEGGIHDVLIASSVIQPGDLKTVARLNRNSSVMVSVDSLESMQALAQVSAGHSLRIPVLVEVDVGLGRSGVVPGPAVPVLARAVHNQPTLIFAGLMAWEGHATHIGERPARDAAIVEAIALVADAARRCELAGMPARIVSCGGTGTFETMSSLAGPTEVQAGGGVFGDLRCREGLGVDLERALTVWSTVLSRPNARRIVCDVGWKALAVYPVAPRPIGLGHIAHIAYAAEHMTITLAQDAAEPAIGERIELEIGYADATTFLHRRMFSLRECGVDATFDLQPAH